MLNKSNNKIVCKTKGFTLVELSIVLVIIGLIVGGIVGGQSLVHNAKINKVVQDFHKIEVAFRAFDMQYDAIPGDMADAWDYWGAACHVTEATCNGDGDNVITGNAEQLMAWRHITLAKIYPGDYSGIGSWADDNAPAGPFENSGYKFRDITGHMIFFGSFNSVGDLSGSILSPEDAKYIDDKVDDGRPRKGKFVAGGGFEPTNTPTVDPNCYTGAGDAAKYNVTYSLPACGVYFIFDGAAW